MAHGKATGRPRSALDTIVTAIAQSNSCIVVTDNERIFRGSRLLVRLLKRYEPSAHPPRIIND
ncbi:hypothetical protein ACRQ1B_24125 [Rhizobium panacihumi]|uniref:hypothetical protein n=1 Tax=Rhizobium panacihumi TaxID=2008450 RepID=UPI003D79B629